MENTTTEAQAPAPKSGGWKVMGIISVVLGGLSILCSFIPCVGSIAMYSGIVATILSIIALVMANSAKASKTMAIIALVLSVASIGIGYWRAKQLADAIGNGLNMGADKFQHALDSINNSNK